MALSAKAKRIGGALFVMFVGGLFIWKGQESLYRGEASEDWPAAEAHITESGWRTRVGDSSDMYPHVKYDYTVEGKQYSSDRLTYASSEELPKHFLDEFPVGATVPVYYDPASPQTSVLITGSTSWHSGTIAVGGIAVCVALVMIGFAVRKVDHLAGLPVSDHLTSSSESRTGLRLPAGPLSLAIAAVALVAVSGLMFHFYGGEKASREEAESVELEPTDEAPDGAPPPKPAAERVEHSPPAPSATRPTIAQTREFSGHTGAVNSVAFCTDGTRFLTGSFDRTIRLWNVDGDEPIRTYTGHESAVCSLAVGEEVFVSGAGDGTARVWRFDGSDEIQRFDDHQGSVHVALLPDSRRLLTGGAEGTVRLRDIDSGEELHRFDVGEPVWCIAAAPSSKLKRGEAAALIGTAKGTVLLWDCVSDQETWRLTGQTSVMDVDFALGGRHAASSHWGRKVNLLDIERGEVIHVFTGYEGPVNSVVFSTDGSWLVSSCGAGKTIRVWNVASREELARAVADEHSTRHSALSPDGTSIVSAGGYFFDREANKFSNDGDYAIRLWQLMTASSR